MSRLCLLLLLFPLLLHTLIPPMLLLASTTSSTTTSSSTAAFHRRLTHYTQHLNHAADTMLLQARAFEREQDEIDADADERDGETIEQDPPSPSSDSTTDSSSSPSTDPPPTTSDSDLTLSPSLTISRTSSSTPEGVRDITRSIRTNNLDPWYTLSGRSKKSVEVKERTLKDMLDADATRCGQLGCSDHGQCVMDMTSNVKSRSGNQNLHSYQCICDIGYAGESCQIAVDQYLRYLLTEGASALPKCCNICDGQRNIPVRWDDIPAYTNPFSTFAPECQPFPRVSRYSRDAKENGELVKGRRPDPKCSEPLGEISRIDPLITLELASSLSTAQRILDTDLLKDMHRFSINHRSRQRLSSHARQQHINRLRTSSSLLKDTSRVAQNAIRKLSERLRISQPLSEVKISDVNLKQLLEDSTELPGNLAECCIYCDLRSADASTEDLAAPPPKGADVGPNAILNQDPNKDTEKDARNRRMALRRADRRYAMLTGTVPREDQDCCLVCPYHLREEERLREAEQERKRTGTPQPFSTKSSSTSPTSSSLLALKHEMNRVFLETSSTISSSSTINRDRHRSQQPQPCCPACPSQFLAAHAFPEGPFTHNRTRWITGPGG